MIYSSILVIQQNVPVPGSLELVYLQNIRDILFSDQVNADP